MQSGESDAGSGAGGGGGARGDKKKRGAGIDGCFIACSIMIFLVGMILVIVFGIQVTVLNVNAHKYNKTTCEVVLTSLHSSGGLYRGTVIVLYFPTPQNETQATAYHNAGHFASTKELENSWLGDYHVGDLKACYYDPNNWSNVVLERYPSGGDIAGLVIGCLLLPAGIALFWWSKGSASCRPGGGRTKTTASDTASRF